MTSPKTIDYFLLTTLALIWASAFFNIKIATYSYGPITIAFLRILFGAIPVVILCFAKNIKIEADKRLVSVFSRSFQNDIFVEDGYYSNNSKISEFDNVISVSYTHLTLPTTPYV